MAEPCLVSLGWELSCQFHIHDVDGPNQSTKDEGWGFKVYAGDLPRRMSSFLEVIRITKVRRVISLFFEVGSCKTISRRWLLRASS